MGISCQLTFFWKLRLTINPVFNTNFAKKIFERQYAKGQDEQLAMKAQVFFQFCFEFKCRVCFKRQ